MKTGYQILLGTLPVKCNKFRNRQEGNTLYVMCWRHKETLKHLLCSCSNGIIKNLKTARHDKIVNELKLWGEIATRKGKIISVKVNPRTDTVQVRRPDLLFVHSKGDRIHHTFIEITVAMDNVIKRAKNRKKEKYRDIIKQHREANPDIKAWVI